MNTVAPGQKTYGTDSQGFLRNPMDWDEGFAATMAPRVDIPGGLTPRHWEVIRFIREEYRQSGECPLVFTTCRAVRLSLREMEALFPTGYLRGACRLAGVTYRDRFVDYFGEKAAAQALRGELPPGSTALPVKTYRVDVLGFLVDPAEWDEDFAVHKAREMKMPAGLTSEHMEILRCLRDRFQASGVVPTVLDCCRANGLELEELERLFPDGYHRGAVKLAGLCVRTGG
jgi:tRNA 2-thiouridine synthesizing protein E